MSSNKEISKSLSLIKDYKKDLKELSEKIIKDIDSKERNIDVLKQKILLKIIE